MESSNNIIDIIIKLLENVGFPIVAAVLLYRALITSYKEIIKILKRLLNAVLSDKEREVKTDNGTDTSNQHNP